jgi:hypothetical protein
MKKTLILLVLTAFSTFSSVAQCSFESLFPLSWGSPRYSINEHFNTSPLFHPSKDSIRGSAFEHGLDYFFTARNMRLSFFSYENTGNHPCLNTGHVVLNCIANDSGLVAYNYQVTYPASEHAAYVATLDSLKAMMQKKFTYNSTVKTPTKAIDANNSPLAGYGVCVYFNDEPIVSTNLTYPQFVIRAGYLAKQPAASTNGSVSNQAEEIQYYRIEILYKKTMPKW